MNGIDLDPGAVLPAPDEQWLFAWGGANVSIGASSLLVPLYVVQLGGDAFALGLLWFATSLAMVPGALGVGKLVDRTGRHRPFALAGLVGVTLTLAVVPFLETVAAVLVVDAALWLFVASVTPVLTLLVLADVPENRWDNRIAVLNKYQGYGWAGGLVLGAVWTRAFAGVFSPLGVQRSLLAFCAGLLVVSVVAAARWLPEEESEPEKPPLSRSKRARRAVRGSLSPLLPGRFVSLARTKSPRRVLRSLKGPLGVYFLAVTLFFTGFSVFSAPLPDFLTQAGFGDDAIFVLYVVSSLASAVFYVGAGELAGRYDLRLLQSGALGMRVVAFPAIAVVGFGVHATSPLALLAIGVLFGTVGLSWAVIAVTANSLVARYASPSRRGAALGLYTALSAGAGGIGGLAGGWLATSLGYVSTFGVAGGLVLVGSALVLVLHFFVPGGRHRPAERSA